MNVTRAGLPINDDRKLGPPSLLYIRQAIQLPITLFTSQLFANLRHLDVQLGMCSGRLLFNIQG